MSDTMADAMRYLAGRYPAIRQKFMAVLNDYERKKAEVERLTKRCDEFARNAQTLNARLCAEQAKNVTDRKPNPTVRDLVKQGLAAGGYDGLFDEDGECACLADDLFPCYEVNPNCIAGYKVPCGCGDECKWAYYGLNHWHIQREKPEGMQNHG